MRGVGVVAVASAVSRLTGFLRTVVLTAAIGLGLVGDAYNTANQLSTIGYELLLGGVLASIVVPLLTQAARLDTDGGLAYTQRLLTVAVVGLAAATALAVLAAPALVAAYGIRDDPAQVALATTLARLLLVEIVFYGLGGLAGAILNSRGVFGAPAWAPVLNNLVVIATAAVLISQRGPGPFTPVTITTGQVWLLGVGSALGIVLQAAALLPALRRAGFRWRWRFDWTGTRLGEAGRLGAWVLTDCGLSQAGFLVIIAVANAAGRASGTGSTVFSHANLLLQVPYGILAVALLTVLLPRMSRAAAAGDEAAVRADLARGHRLATIALVPMSGLLIALGPALAVVVFARGAADPIRAHAVGVALAVSAFALLPEAASTLQRQAFYAVRDGRTPTVINAVMVGVRIPAALACGLWLPPRLVVAGLSVVLGASYLAGVAAGAERVRRRFGLGAGSGVGSALARVLVATGVGTAATGAVAQWCDDPLTAVLIGGPTGLMVIGLCLVALRLPELRTIVERLRRRDSRPPDDDPPDQLTRSDVGTFTT